MEIFIGKRLFRNGDDLYVILREMNVSKVTNKNGTINAEAFNAWKEYLGADKVLKNGETFLFCETVPEPEWEEIPLKETEDETT